MPSISIKIGLISISNQREEKLLIFSSDKYAVNASVQVYCKQHTTQFGHSWLTLIKIKWLLEHLRVLQGRTGFTSSLWCRTEKWEASGQNWVKSAKLHQIAGQKWQVELWVCEIHLQSWMEPEAAMAVGVCRTGPHAFFWSTSCFHRILLAKSHTLHEPPNVQTCSVWQSPLSTSHPMVVFQAKESVSRAVWAACLPRFSTPRYLHLHC